MSSWLAQAAPAGAAPASRPAPAQAAPPRPAAGRGDGATRAEISFLAQCLATPAAARRGPRRHRDRRAVRPELTRRAAHLVQARLGGQPSDPPPDDEELTALWARLAVVAGQRRASEDVLHSDRIELALHALRRDASLTPGQRAARERDLRAEKDRHDARVFDETRPARPLERPTAPVGAVVIKLRGWDSNPQPFD